MRKDQLLEPSITRFSRRRFLKSSAAASASAFAPYIGTGRAAGSLSVGFWEHVLPEANTALARLCNDWAKKQKVDLKIDFVSLLLPAIFSEAQAKSGHDIVALPAWTARAHADSLEPVDDIMTLLIAQNGG